jgi:hypothetical protein
MGPQVYSSILTSSWSASRENSLRFARREALDDARLVPLLYPETHGPDVFERTAQQVFAL